MTDHHLYLQGKPADDFVEVHEHVSPIKSYINVFAALLVLTRAQAGHAAGKGFESRVALQREVGAAQRVDRFGGLLHIRFAALGGRDHHFLELEDVGGRLVGVVLDEPPRVRLSADDALRHAVQVGIVRFLA